MRKETLEFLVELSRQRLIMGNDQDRLLGVLDDVGDGKRLNKI